MTTTTMDTVDTSDTHTHHCPLCGAVLEPRWDGILCPTCALDQAEKLADYLDEQRQARFPL